MYSLLHHQFLNKNLNISGTKEDKFPNYYSTHRPNMVIARLTFVVRTQRTSCDVRNLVCHEEKW